MPYVLFDELNERKLCIPKHYFPNAQETWPIIIVVYIVIGCLEVKQGAADNVSSCVIV